jgi:Leucine-rich repeat (LRR) protein
MGLTEIPSELFRMKNLKKLWLSSNKLCSLPSEIAHLATLEMLWESGCDCRSDWIVF